MQQEKKPGTGAPRDDEEEDPSGEEGSTDDEEGEEQPEGAGEASLPKRLLAGQATNARRIIPVFYRVGLAAS